MFNTESVQRYMDQARSFPYLTREQEEDFARRFADSRDPKARDAMIGSHMRLVAKVARKFSGYGLSFDELLSEGSVGLVLALEKFDPSRGFRFSTYAQWWVKAAITEYVVRAASLVRMGSTADQKRLFFGLRRLKSKLGVLSDGDMPEDVVAEIAMHMGVAAKDVVSMNRRLGGDSSLNALVGGPAGEGSTEVIELLVDDSPGSDVVLAELDELDHRRDMLQTALGRLDHRERRIIEMRHLAEEPSTLEVLSVEFGVSRERIRQIEGKAFQKVQRSVIAIARTKEPMLEA